MRRKWLLSLTFSITFCWVPFFFVKDIKSQSPPSATRPMKANNNRELKRDKEGPRDGARVFEQNCSRCHTAPDGFSTRISGTVIRHMRVRASLSRSDETLLMQFLNP